MLERYVILIDIVRCCFSYIKTKGKGDAVANIENLKVPTHEEAVEYGRRGGIASGEARRRKKALREHADMYLLRSELISRIDDAALLRKARKRFGKYGEFF